MEMSNLKKTLEDRYKLRLDYEHYKQKVDDIRSKGASDPVKLMRVFFLIFFMFFFFNLNRMKRN